MYSKHKEKSLMSYYMIRIRFHIQFIQHMLHKRNINLNVLHMHSVLDLSARKS